MHLLHSSTRNLTILFIFLSKRRSPSSLTTNSSVVRALTPMFSSSCSQNNSNNSNNSSNQGIQVEDDENTKKLQTQWSLGRDVWKDVPVLSPSSTYSIIQSTIHIQTKVRTEPSYDTAMSSSSSPWPDIVQNSILYGFGAYNPRGEVLPNDINRKQHLLMQSDIENGIQEMKMGKTAFWWQGASIWEDGSSERGFIVAFKKNEGCNSVGEGKSRTDLGNDNVVQGEKEKIRMKKANDFIIQLAAKYNQGAVYRFEMDINGRLMRETIPVLDPGTDSCLEVEIDHDALIDLSLFE